MKGIYLGACKAQMYFNREVRCITTEKWRGVYYPNHQIIIVVEKWEIEDR